MVCSGYDDVMPSSSESTSEAVVVLREGADSSALKRELQAMHLRLEPLFPGATIPADQCWYLLIAEAGTSDNDLDAILHQIRGIRSVDAAYRKPPAETPEDSPP